MNKLRLKCRNLSISYETNEFLQERKEIKKAWHWSIDKVWEKFHKDKSEAMRFVLQDHYWTISNYIRECIIEVKFPGFGELNDIDNAGMDIVNNAINAFDRGGDEKFKSYCISRIRRAMFDKVRSKVIKRRLGDHGEKITDLCLRSLPLGRPKKAKWYHEVSIFIIKSKGLINEDKN